MVGHNLNPEKKKLFFNYCYHQILLTNKLERPYLTFFKKMCETTKSVVQCKRSVYILYISFYDISTY